MLILLWQTIPTISCWEAYKLFQRSNKHRGWEWRVWYPWLMPSYNQSFLRKQNKFWRVNSVLEHKGPYFTASIRLSEEGKLFYFAELENERHQYRKKYHTQIPDEKLLLYCHNKSDQSESIRCTVCHPVVPKGHLRSDRFI